MWPRGLQLEPADRRNDKLGNRQLVALHQHHPRAKLADRIGRDHVVEVIGRRIRRQHLLAKFDLAAVQIAHDFPLEGNVNAGERLLVIG